MNTELTLPGTIPGLLRRGSPVVAEVTEPIAGPLFGVVWVAPAGFLGGSVAAPNDGNWPRGEAETHAPGLYSLPGPLAWCLDLTDATGRAHAAWWLADRLTALGNAIHPEARAAVDDLGLLRPTQPSPTHPGALVWLAYGWPFLLADLDPADPRLLPDGSRWVDAEALRLVVLHVAGVPS